MCKNKKIGYPIIHGGELILQILRLQHASRVHMRCTLPAACCMYGILPSIPHIVFISSGLNLVVNISLHIPGAALKLLKKRCDYNLEFLAAHATCGLHWSCKSFMRCTHNRLHSSLDYIRNNVDNAAIFHWFSWHMLSMGFISLIFTQSIWNQIITPICSV